MKSKPSKSNGNGSSHVQKMSNFSSKRDETQGQLQAARSQLLVYAKDLKKMLEKEEQKAQALKEAHAQLLSYAQDLKLALDAEQHKNNELEQSYTDTMLRLAKASRYKDEETGAHIERLSHYAKAMALNIGWMLRGHRDCLPLHQCMMWGRLEYPMRCWANKGHSQMKNGRRLNNIRSWVQAY